MGQFATRRFVALVLWVLGALYSGARLMLDMIGYTTAPEDFAQLQQELPDWLEWLFSTPWWVPGGLMLVLTLFVIWVSWPKEKKGRESRFAGKKQAPVNQIIDYKIDPWVAKGQRTYAKVKIDIDNWRADAIEKENIYVVKVSFIGEGHKNIEMVVIFDQWVPNPGLTIECDRKEEGYQTEQTDLDDRYAICRLYNIKVPCVVELDFD